jgi:hypothetical protein
MGKHPKTTTNPKYETHRKRLRFIKILLACASSILLISAGVSIGYVVLNNKIASSKSPILVLPKPNSITIHGETEVGCIRGETTTSSYYVMNNFGVVDYDIN